MTDSRPTWLAFRLRAPTVYYGTIAVFAAIGVALAHLGEAATLPPYRAAGIAFVAVTFHGFATEAAWVRNAREKSLESWIYLAWHLAAGVFALISLFVWPFGGAGTAGPLPTLLAAVLWGCGMAWFFSRQHALPIEAYRPETFDALPAFRRLLYRLWPLVTVALLTTLALEHGADTPQRERIYLAAQLAFFPALLRPLELTTPQSMRMIPILVASLCVLLLSFFAGG